MRKRLLEQVQARLERFATGRDRAAVLDPEAVAEVTALLGLVADPATDLEIALAAGWLHWARYLVLPDGEDQQDLTTALALFTPVYQARPYALPDQVRAAFLEEQRNGTPAALAGRAVVLLRETMRTGNRPALDDAIALLRQAVKATPPDHPNRAGYLSNLGAALRVRFERAGQVRDLDAAISAGQGAVEASPPDHPDRAGYLSNLGLALQARFERVGQVRDLDAAISAGQAAVEASPPDHPKRAMYLSNLGGALQVRFARAGQVTDLDAAISVGQAAVEATPPDHPNSATMLSNLCAALWARFERVGQVTDVDAAISAGQAAVEATPPDHPNSATTLSNLCLALRARFERVGQVRDLDAAISAGQAAVEATPPDHPNRARHLSNLGGALQGRFERVGRIADVDAAISVGQAAVEATPPDHPNRAMYLSNLGGALRARFERVGQVRDLDAAISVGQAAVEATPPDHPDRAGRLSSLGLALQARFARAGQLTDLGAAIGAGQAAVEATPPDHPDRARYLANLGGALWARFERVGQLTDLDAAISAGQAAVEATPPDHPDRAGMLANLGGALQARFERAGQIPDLDAAIEVYRTGVGLVGASPRVRAGAARGWGWAAAGGGRWEEAVAGFTAAAELLSQVAPRSLTRGDQEHLLAELGSLGADAASCCVRAGLVGRAVELFEQGRGVLLGQALDTRTDLTALTEQHPDPAASFLRLRDVLDQTDDPAVPDLPRPGEGTASATGVEQQAAGVAFEELIASIRRLDGFETFLRPPPIDDLLATAAQGPVVAVAVSPFGSYALLLTAGGVETVPLAGLTPQTVYDQVVAFLDALAEGTSATAQRRLVEILGWLWDVLAGPVLDRLGLTGPPAGGQRWPRLWWCTSGLLSFLPLHAAGHHDSRSDPAPATVIDRVVSSYTPTIRALAHARPSSPAASGGGGGAASLDGARMAVVAMPHTAAAVDLPGARAEADALRQRFGNRVEVLTGPRATREAVLSMLPTVRWAHFACHGTAEIDNPSTSRLLLHDHQTRPLTVLDVARLRLTDAQLAYLSACETARPGGRLTDEAIHLASAFQLAGYQHVIATLWPIADRPAVDIADDIYTTLTATGDVAEAVHTTTRRWRRRWPRTPSVWASHIHAGA